MKTVDLVIFDCDGVIVDSEGLLNEIVAKSLTDHGLPISAEECHKRFVGGTMYILRDRAIEAGAKLPENWVNEIYAEIFERLRQGVDVSKGFIELIDNLQEHGVKIAVASNGPMDKMRASLGPSGLFDRLDGRIFSAHDHNTAKPEPKLLELAAQAAGVAIERAVMVDDSPAGVGAARAAGMRFIGYAEHGNEDKLTEEGADIVYSMRELKERLSAL